MWTGKVDSKYHSREHRTLRARYVRMIKQGQPLDCTAKVCVFGDSPITNPNGRDRDGLHLGHADNGIDYDGPQHNACNTKDAARRGHQASRKGARQARWEL